MLERKRLQSECTTFENGKFGFCDWKCGRETGFEDRESLNGRKIERV
jgi:hypothetical protein